MAKIEVYTIDEVCEILKLTRRTLYTYIKNGDLKASKVGRSWRVSAAALQEFLEQKASV